MPTCENHGAVVGPDDWLPETPFDRDFGDLSPAIGCNNLTCQKCGERVESEVTAARPHVRDYRCACATLAVASPFVPSKPATYEDEGPPWACAGHAPLTIPASLDGVQLDDAMDVDTLVTDVMDGIEPATVPWPPKTSRPGLWLVRVAVATMPSDFAVRLCMAVAGRLEDPDPLRQRAAWEFYWHLPDAPGGERLGVAFGRMQARFATTMDPVRGTTKLHWFAVDTLQRRMTVRNDDGSPADTQALQALRDAVVNGPDPKQGLFVLGLIDAAWLCSNADRYLARHPGHVGTLVGASGPRSTPALGDALARHALTQPAARADVLSARPNLSEPVRTILDNALRP